jgi:hypothetical protein
LRDFDKIQEEKYQKTKKKKIISCSPKVHNIKESVGKALEK